MPKPDFRFIASAPQVSSNIAERPNYTGDLNRRPSLRREDRHGHHISSAEHTNLLFEEAEKQRFPSMSRAAREDRRRQELLRKLEQ